MARQTASERLREARRLRAELAGFNFANPAARKLGIMAIKNGQCRFILGDPAVSVYRFCAADVPAGSGSSYCEYCRPMLYRKFKESGE